MITEEIIVRYLSGESTAKENMLVASWLSESPDNRKILEQCYFIWKSANCLHIIESIDSKKKLNALKSHVKKKNRKIAIRTMLHWTQRGAAILLLPALLLSYYFYGRNDKESDDIMQYLEVRTNPGMISSVILPDSSKVWINSCGYLKYPVRFTADRREVTLEGEGYFEVRKNESSPFTVSVNDNYAIEVLGTKFNVAAYSDDEYVETTLVEGSVQLNIKTESGEQIKQRLKPNQKGVFWNNSLALEQVDPLYATSWIEGKIYFKNEPMTEVLKRLSRHYNIEFDVKNPEIYESLITAKFDTEHLSQVLEYLELASNIKYKIQKNSINDDRINHMKIELTK